ncbi:putative allantoinase 1 [Lipomyces oligophaga]|uniref:putative allantoinase 1 n=1 Tax=Lipomyces oligophaga TaxID=45792 RepID=UPI0034CFC72E
MTEYILPTPGTFASLSTDECSEIIIHLFERSAALETLIMPFFLTESSYITFISRTRSELLNLSDEAETDSVKKSALFEILGAHPRLGARKVESVHSVAEQASLQGEGQKLAALNTEYERAFPGLRYVVFVNGRSRDVIMTNMRERIDRANYYLEKIEAINAMCDIATDRARKLGAEVL